MPAPWRESALLENYPTIGQNGSSFTGPEPLLAENRLVTFPVPGSTLPETEHMVKFVNGQMLYSHVVCKRSSTLSSSLRRHANVHSWRRTAILLAIATKCLPWLSTGQDT